MVVVVVVVVVEISHFWVVGHISPIEIRTRGGGSGEGQPSSTRMPAASAC